MRVLIIEDNGVTQEALETLFKKHGFEVDYAGNAMGAITRLSVRKTDIIICDYLMPGIDGLEFLTSLRNTEEYKNLPVILFTAVADLTEIEKKIGHLQPAILLQKPVEPLTLLGIVTKTLEALALSKSEQSNTQ